MEMQFEVPERTYKQRRGALDKGNRIRSVRAQFKKDVKAGKRSVRAILLADPSARRTSRRCGSWR
jgi:hypothetical protein